jgi:hypothetical protein
MPMVITALSLRNFRSFREAQFRLGQPFVLLVGRNAAGKTNLLQGFLFLRDIARSGLTNAISLQGGLTYLQNTGLACGRNLSVGVELTLPGGESTLGQSDGGIVVFSPGCCFYTFELGCDGSAHVLSDRFTMAFTLTRPGGEPMPGKMDLVHEQDRVHYLFALPEGIDDTVILPRVMRDVAIAPGSLLLESPTLFPMGLVRRALALIACYEFGPRLPRHLDKRTGAAELNEDGSNASIALARVLADPEHRRQFLTLARDLLPFIEDVVVGDGPDGAFEIRVSETYAPGRYLPAETLSSGTVELFAFLVALFFTPRELAIFEEPVGRMHPSVVSKLVGLIRDAARTQPMIVSTNSPQILRDTPVDALCLISRDDEGFSTLSWPAERVDIMTFLEEEVGLDELYLADLL